MAKPEPDAPEPADEPSLGDVDAIVAEGLVEVERAMATAAEFERALKQPDQPKPDYSMSALSSKLRQRAEENANQNTSEPAPIAAVEPIEDEPMQNFDSIAPVTVNRFAPFTAHPVAALFPLMSDAELAVLAADIKENGQREDILVSPDETTVYDGRNRFLSCKIVGVEPRLAKLFDPKGNEYDEAGIIRYITSANLHRRHLDHDDRAFLAVELEKRYAIEAKGRQQQSGGGTGRKGGDQRTVVMEPTQPLFRSVDQAAKDVGVGRTAVQQAKKLLDEAPDLAEQVKAGGLSLNAAAKAHKARSAQPEQEADEDHHADDVARKRVAAQGSDLEARVKAYGKRSKPEPPPTIICLTCDGAGKVKCPTCHGAKKVSAQ